MNETSKLLEIRLLVDQKVIEETLTRIGIVDKKRNGDLRALLYLTGVL